MRKLPLLLVLAAGLAAPLAASAETGQETFKNNCEACHQATGLGIKDAFPALKGSKVVLGPPAGVITTVLNGRAAMPAFKSQLNDAQLAGVITYVRSAWGNKASPVKPAEVRAKR